MNAINQNEKKLSNRMPDKIDTSKIKICNTAETPISQASNFRSTVQNAKFSFFDSLSEIINIDFFLRN